MPRALFQCDEAVVPASWNALEWDTRERLNHRTGERDLNLVIENLSHACLRTVDDHAADLVRIAAYVYGADQVVPRGGSKDVYGRHWRREMSLAIPVSDPQFWNQDTVKSQLEGLLSFLTDDLWQFAFSRGTPEDRQLVLNFEGPELESSPDTLALFSGGADSLCAVVEGVGEQGRKPLLVSHRSTFRTNSRQRELVGELRKVFTQWSFPHISVWVHRKRSEASETSQRSRAFLYASLGMAIASQLGIRAVTLADNGVVSLNPPISDQLVGALATRSTHPKFLYLFAQLCQVIFPSSPTLDNPLKYRTRPEVLSVLQRQSCTSLLQETVSCAHNRGRPNVQPHCGVCSQCVDRRFATAFLDLEEHDLTERYGVDIFTQPLEAGSPRTVSESYVRFALDLARTSEDDLFETYPQLYDYITPDDNPVATASQLASLLQRHSLQVMRVMETKIAEHTSDLVAGTLPDSCLVFRFHL